MTKKKNEYIKTMPDPHFFSAEIGIILLASPIALDITTSNRQFGLPFILIATKFS